MTENKQQQEESRTAFLPDLIYAGGRFESGVALDCDRAGRVLGLKRREDVGAGSVVRLKGKALLPGMVNAHSHAFQRVIRGRTERRTAANDSFWTWREMMYSAAVRLTPEEILDASRMAFLEMALGGITAVGEFHYIHLSPGGEPYDEPNLMAKAVVEAARDVGIRIALLRVAYARAGYKAEPNPLQSRFIEAGPETYLRNVESLRADLARGDPQAVWAGVAPHSVRAVPLPYLREVVSYAAGAGLPVHMHVAEQPAETAACMEEHGRTPVELLSSEELLSRDFTAVHAVHVTPEEARSMAAAGALVCACPTTERNLGDGIVPADLLFAEGVRVALGTDSHAQIDLLEDARELEYHLRLRTLERAVLSPSGCDEASALARRLFDCATVSGAQSIGAGVCDFSPGSHADFFTVDLNDTSVAGSSREDLLSNIVFGLARTAVRDVFVGARAIVTEGRHKAHDYIVEKFTALQSRLWG